jgi:GntR family transcriptional repressor for pyruvate dehydrogenase complex
MRIVPPMSTVKASRSSIHDEVAQAIKHIIVESDLQPGDKLPSQTELAARLQVGSRSVREATKALEARGILEIHHGKGVFLKSTNLDYFMKALGDSLMFNPSQSRRALLELTYVRTIIESNVIHDLASRPDAESVKRLVDILGHMERAIEAGNVEEYNQLDIKFHKTVVGSSRNEILNSLYKYLSNLLSASVSSTALVEGSLADGLQEHRQMVKALVDRDPEQAKAAMSRHIRKTQDKLEHLNP